MYKATVAWGRCGGSLLLSHMGDGRQHCGQVVIRVDSEQRGQNSSLQGMITG